MNEKKYTLGFTLVELMLVVLIIGILASIVGPKLTNQRARANERAAKMQAKIFEMAIDTYELDVGTLPESLDDLLSDSGVSGWNGPYLKGNVLPTDPWGNPYVYAKGGNQGAAYEVYSTGADGVDGNEDDIVVSG